MESSFFNISSEISFGGVFVGDWQNGKMESEQKLEKKSQVPGIFLGLFKSQWQNGKMESSFFNISSELSFEGVFVGEWQNGKMESEQNLKKITSPMNIFGAL